MLVNVTEVVDDQGSIVLFGGTLTEDGRYVVFAVDHRMAQGLADALFTGEYGEAPLAEVESWQVIG